MVLILSVLLFLKTTSIKHKYDVITFDNRCKSFQKFEHLFHQGLIHASIEVQERNSKREIQTILATTI